MVLKDLLEAKKSHDECSDEIDAHHAAAMKSLKDLKNALGSDVSLETQQKHLKDAMSNLGKAMSLATNWNKRCG